jgi:hypothetical protein
MNDAYNEMKKMPIRTAGEPDTNPRLRRGKPLLHISGTALGT